MRAWLTVFALACATGAAAASAMSNGTGAGADQPGRRSNRSGECFSTRFVTDFRPVNRDQVDITVSGSRVYRLDLGPGCFDLDWANHLAIVSRGGGSYVCGNLGAEIFTPNPGGPRSRCIVTGMRRLSDAELQARRFRGRR